MVKNRISVEDIMKVKKMLSDPNLPDSTVEIDGEKYYVLLIPEEEEGE